MLDYSWELIGEKEQRYCYWFFKKASLGSFGKEGFDTYASGPYITAASRLLRSNPAVAQHRLPNRALSSTIEHGERDNVKLLSKRLRPHSHQDIKEAFAREVRLVGDWRTSSPLSSLNLWFTQRCKRMDDAAGYICNKIDLYKRWLDGHAEDT
uniref:Uncharacterized protein n=1 Tax=Parascaris equorum TaxID=6256 RepID=A0A914RQE3_PAREQ